MTSSFMDTAVVLSIGWQRSFDTTSPHPPYDYSLTIDSIIVDYDTVVQLHNIVAQVNGPDVYSYGHNGQMKVNEIAGVGNHYTAQYWEQDPRVGRRWNQDPVPRPSISNYSTFGNNPIWFKDVLGDDWYKDKDGKTKFDPNVHSGKDLKDGQSYIGAKFEEREKNSLTQYRKDGSIKYSNETKAYQRMVDATKESGGGTHEEMGILSKDGVLVLPDYLNDASTSEVEAYGYKWSNGNLYDPVSRSNINILGTIHTHQGDLGANGAHAGPSLQDLNIFTAVTPNKPFMTMGYDGKVHAKVGDKTGYSKIQLPKGYSTVKDLLSGAKLIELLKSN